MKQIFHKTIIAATLLAMLPGATVFGQQTLEVRDFDYIKRSSGELSSPNAAWLQSDATPNISYVEGYFDKTTGENKNYYESNNIYDFGLKTESFRAFDKISFRGKMQYEYFDGRAMSGSMLMNPYEYPFDILEFTPGRKTGEKYIFSGGVGLKLSEKLNAGLSADYETDNYAKRKDLRHKNTRMDMDLSAGVNYALGQFVVGLNYTYGKHSERVEGQVIGTTNVDGYWAFFDRGLWYGSRALWESNQIHLKATGISAFPAKADRHGANLQLKYSEGKSVWFNEFGYTRTAGEAGEKGTVWTFTNGDLFTYSTTYTLDAGRVKHHIRGGASYENALTYENILDNEVRNGYAYVTIKGNTLTLQERKLSLDGAYELAIGGTCDNPEWLLSAGGEYTAQSGVSSLMYPEYRQQNIQRLQLWIGGDKRFILNENSQLDTRLGFRVIKGMGNKMLGAGDKGWTVSDDAEATAGDYPLLLTDYLDYEYRYLTRGNVGVDVGVRYTHRVGRRGMPVYVDVGYSWLAAGMSSVLQSRNVATIKIGCMF
jgi:hypothetical protein